MKKVFLILTVAAMCGFSTSAKIWRVNNTPSVSADFNDLETALASTQVLAGDTIYVEGSAYEYKINNVTKKVTLIGPGYLLSENPNTLENQASAIIKHTTASNLYLLAQGIVCEGLQFNCYLNIGNDDIIIRKCYFGSSSYNAIYWGNNTTGSQVIKNTVITQCRVNKIEGNTSGGTSDYADGAVITNNIVNTISYQYNATVEYNTCLVGTSLMGSISSIYGNSAIKHNIVKQIVNQSDNGTSTIVNNHAHITTDFITASTSTDGMWQLASSSYLKTSGPNGGEIGAFGGAAPYVLSGLPNIPHIYEIIAPTSASSASGLRVTVKIKTDN